MNKPKKILAYIPARGGSKRIPNKNLRDFLGKPLIAYAIETARGNTQIDRVIVDTDAEAIAEVAKQYGAEVPFLRPSHLATDSAQLFDTVLYVLDKLKADEQYSPDYVMLITPNSVFTNQDDLDRCVELLETTATTSVATVCDTQPLLFNMAPDKTISLANKVALTSTNSQELPSGYQLNGNVFLIATDTLRQEKKFFTPQTKAVVMPRWRSIDIDTPEDFAMAEIIYKNQAALEEKIKQLTS